MLLHIKNMVCDRCIMVVRQQLEHLDFHVGDISLGLAEVQPEPTDSQKNEIASSLKVLGFELIDKEKDQLAEQIKTSVIGLIHHSGDGDLHVNFPQALSERFHREYTWISRLFSETQEMTLEKFIIQQKIEKVKELLQYDELTLTEIAWKMGYSSGSHLSNQFKNVTGISAKNFKTHHVTERKPLDKVDSKPKKFNS